MSSMLPDEDEQLTTGWEPGGDDTDSLVRQAVAVHASWATTTAASVGRPTHDGPEWAAGHASDRAAMANWVIVKRPLLDVARVYAEVDAFFGGVGPYLMVSPWFAPPGPLGDLRLLGHPPLMFRPAVTATDLPPSDLELRWVTDEAGLVDAERVLVEGYPLPELQPFSPGHIYAPPMLETATRIVVAYDGATPVATAAAHSAAGVTLVEGVATMPEARGRGVGAAVTLAASTAFDGQSAVLIASDDGQPVYERLGYLRLERWTAWLRL